MIGVITKLSHVICPALSRADARYAARKPEKPDSLIRWRGKYCYSIGLARSGHVVAVRESEQGVGDATLNGSNSLSTVRNSNVSVLSLNLLSVSEHLPLFVCIFHRFPIPYPKTIIIWARKIVFSFLTKTWFLDPMLCCVLILLNIR